MTYLWQAEALMEHLRIAPFLDALRATSPDAVDLELWDTVLDQAGRFAAAELEPLGRTLDQEGVMLRDGTVRTASAHGQAWRAFRDAGWITLSLPEEVGGQGLPLVLSTACEEIFNRASAAFMMLPTPNRTAAALLHRLAEPSVREEWVPKLADGTWGATI